MRVTYRYIRPATVVYVRTVGPYAASAREAWDVMGRWLDDRKVRRQVRRGFGFFRDNPVTTEAHLLRYDACVEVIPGLDADAEAGIGRQVLPGGAYGVHTHVGSYDQTGILFSQLHRELVPKGGLSVDHERPFLCIHLNDPKYTTEVHRRTELCIPVLPARLRLPVNDTGDGDEALLAPVERYSSVG